MPCDICPVALVHGIAYCPSPHAPHVILRYCQEHYGERSPLPLRCFRCNELLVWAHGDAADRVIRPLDHRVAQAASLEAIRYKEPPRVQAEVEDELDDEDDDDDHDDLELAPSVHEFPPTDDVVLVVHDDEEQQRERTQALRKIKEQLAQASPTQISVIEPCDRDRPSTIAVVLRSSDPEVFALESGEIRFVIKGSSIRRRRTTATGIKLMISAPQLVVIEGYPAEAAEFTQPTLSKQVELQPGGHEDVELVFTPKPPRRYHPRFMFFDSLDEEERQARPFPAKLVAEIVFDDSNQSVVRVELLADGTCTDPDDGEAGVRMLYRHRKVRPRFAPVTKRCRLAWTTDSAATSPTATLEEGTAPREDQSILHLLPKTRWSPFTPTWTLPAVHLGDDERVIKDIDISGGASVGSAEEPVTYVLERLHGSLINDKRIDHVVVLMLENRGFDHFMGWLYDETNPPPHRWPAEAPESQADLRPFEGLDGLPPEVLDNPYDYRDESGKVHRDVIRPRKGARASNIPTTNPHEDFIHIFQDMYGKDVPFRAMAEAETRDPIVKHQGRYRVPPMNGWVQNFANAIEHHRKVKTFEDSLLSEIMDMYVPEQLPVMSGLAKSFAISDMWFCSVPSQTNTNRAFWAAGTAVGLVTNNYYDAYAGSWDPRMMAMRKIGHGSHADALPNNPRSMFDVLHDKDIDWKYYWETKWPPGLVGGGQYFRTMFKQFEPAAFDPNFPKTADFLADARAGTLPMVTYIEPTWGGGTHWEASARGVGNEFHPVEDVAVGEDYVKSIYDALSQGAAWDRTLLVITFDENGGTYDHFPPPAAQPSGREGGTTQFGFRFDCYGVRVPTLVISRYVTPGTLFRSPTDVPLDHTSIISTILEWQGIDPAAAGLGTRVAQAPTFGGLLETDGSQDGARSRGATSLPPPAREEDSEPLRYGEEFYLRYIGSRWPREVRPDGEHYLGGPVWFKRYQTYYPNVTKKAQALRFRLQRGDAEGNVEAGEALTLVVASGPQAGHTLAVPEAYGANTVYLYDGKNPSKWVVWLFESRVKGSEIHPNDEVVIFSERYLPHNVSTTVTDPLQKLTVEAKTSGWVDKNRYAKFRAGQWDIWKLEPA